MKKSQFSPEQIGFVLEKLELLAFQTTFDPRQRTGQLPINTSLIDKNKFKKALTAMKDVFKAEMCVSELVATASEGENGFGYHLQHGCKRSTSPDWRPDGVPVWRRA